MAKKQFKAESKRMLDLMINSIYTHREIFLRELISNASDAMDKMYYKALTEHIDGFDRAAMEIRLVPDKDARTLTITDSGCGMTKEDLENNLGVIAHSGSRAFKQDLDEKDKDNVDIIGQFGVGFYSAFMVSDKIEVRTRAYGADEAYCWTSSGADGYSIEPCDKTDVGTVIVLHIKPSSDEEKYDEFLEPYRLQSLVKKYSDYIRYPIRMDMEKQKLKEGSKDDYESYTETETLNSMVPLWRKNKKEITPEEYNTFYKEKFMDYEDPAYVIHSATEGTSTYNALLFIPSRAPYDYYTREYEKGLQLYASGVLIMDKCADLLPDYFSFVKGLVDSQDLSLNISREMLQHDRQLKLIASHLEKKIHSELLALMTKDREKYNEFFTHFGLQLKYGLYADFGQHKDSLKDLVLFTSSFEDKPVTLAEYAGRMKNDQKFIYYACGESAEKIRRLPQAETVLDKGYELLLLTQDVDEFALKMLHDWDGKEFKSIAAGDLGLETDEEKEAAKKQAEENKDMLAFMKDALGEKVSAVRLSSTLKSHPVCLTSEGEISLEMEKVLSSQPNGQGVKASRVLEINENHPLFATLTTLFADDKDRLTTYTQLLYNQALLIEGMSIDDPVAFSNQICDLMK